jgi:hypothetical protein
MRFAKFFALVVGVAFLVVWGANGQPPPFGPKDGKGPKGAKALKGGKADSARLLDDLAVAGEQRDKARAILRAYDEKVRQAVTEARKDLLDKMKDVLGEDDLKTLKEELDQVPLLPPIPPILRSVSADDLVERLMSFDKNGDGKVTKDELPERMHALIEQGDTNGDGALDRAEIRRLAERMNRPGGPPGPGAPGGLPRPPFPPHE